MKVTYNWLKDFVDIKITAPQLADKLTMAGLEVVSLQEKEGDFVFEIEITSNRPDWLSLVGIAREVAALTGRKLKVPQAKSAKYTAGSMQPLAIQVEDKKDCPLYTARIIKDVKVAPSPVWLKKRLELVGCRSVNNIVDITNYVLFELGEPLHAFDLAKLNPEGVIIRRAKNSEKLLTIDGENRQLNSNILVIADREKPIALAGVMGGKDTEVTTGTKDILLESAVFNPVIIRRARQALGIQSEASYRFERGVDLASVEKASLKAARSIQELAGGNQVGYQVKGVTKAQAKNIGLEISKVKKILGLEITVLKIKNILISLGFTVKSKSKNKLFVGVPSFRQDVNLDVDLIEEIARVFGYDKIPQTLPEVKPAVTIREKRELAAAIKNILVGLGLNETITYSLTDRACLESLGLNTESIAIMNPLSQEQEVLRPTLIPGLSRAIAYNLNQKQEHVAFFEIANVFLNNPRQPQEELMLAVALSGTKSFLLQNGLVKDEAGLLNLKGILETLLLRLGIKEFNFVASSDLAVDIYIQEEKVGYMLRLNSRAQDKFEIKNKDVFILEISLDKVLKYAKPDRKFFSPPKYPGITRDISFILKEELSVKDLLGALKDKTGALLRNLRIADYYKGKQIPSGYRGLTISCFYRSDQRTLLETEIEPIHKDICAILTTEFSAKIR